MGAIEGDTWATGGNGNRHHIGPGQKGERGGSPKDDALNSCSRKEEALDRQLQHRLQRVGGLNEIEIDHRIVIQQAPEGGEELREIALGKRIPKAISECKQ